MGNKITPIREVKTVPEKKSVWPAAIISLVIIAGLGAVLFNIISKYNAGKTGAAKATPTPAKTVHTAPSPTAPVTDETPTYNGTDSAYLNTTGIEKVPEPQVIYYGQAGSKMGFYVTTLEMQKYIQKGRTAINAYQGQMYYEDGTYNMAFDFRQMKNAKVVMKSDYVFINGILPAIGGYFRNDKTGMLYLILNTVGSKPGNQINIAEILFRVDLYYGRVRKIMTHQLGVSVPQKGPMNIYEVWHDDYVLLKIDNCISCTNKEPFNWVVANVNTYAFKYLGVVSNVRENPITGELAYRNLVAVVEACGPADANCTTSGEKVVYKPSAKDLTTKLP